MRFSKLSVLALLTFTVAFAFIAVPAYAVDESGHSLTVTTDKSSYSCTGPIVISGIATGRNLLRKDVKITVTNDETGVAVAHGKAKPHGGTYSTTLHFTDTSMPEGYFTVTASWEGQTATTDGSFYWAC